MKHGTRLGPYRECRLQRRHVGPRSGSMFHPDLASFREISTRGPPLKIFLISNLNNKGLIKFFMLTTAQIFVIWHTLKSHYKISEFTTFFLLLLLTIVNHRLEVIADF